MKQQSSLGAKSSNWNMLFLDLQAHNKKASNRRAKSVKSSTAKLHFITVTVLIYERKVALCLLSSKNKNLQYHRKRRSGYIELLSPCSSVPGFYFDNTLPRIV